MAPLCHVMSIPLSPLWQGKRCLINLQISKVDVIFIQRRRSLTAEGFLCGLAHAGMGPPWSIPVPAVPLCVPPSVGPICCKGTEWKNKWEPRGAGLGLGVCKGLWTSALWVGWARKISLRLCLHPLVLLFWVFFKALALFELLLFWCRTH